MLDCPNCGARSPETARFCAACGHALPRAEAAPAPSEDPARFESLRRHPDFERLMAAVPASGGGPGGLLSAVLGAGVLALVAGLLVIPSLAFPPLAVAVAAAGAIGAFVLLHSVARADRGPRGEWTRVPAQVVAERTSFAAAGGASPRYHVSLQSERGTREEYAVEDALASKVEPGDLGVAFFRGGRLVDFEAVISRAPEPAAPPGARPPGDARSGR